MDLFPLSSLTRADKLIKKKQKSSLPQTSVEVWLFAFQCIPANAGWANGQSFFSLFFPFFLFFFSFQHSLFAFQKFFPIFWFAFLLIPKSSFYGCNIVLTFSETLTSLEALTVLFCFRDFSTFWRILIYSKSFNFLLIFLHLPWVASFSQELAIINVVDCIFQRQLW